MRTLVVVPTYQEAENIEQMANRVRDVVPDADLLVVDDNSPDGTGDLAEKVGIERGQISVLRRPNKDGLGNAYRAGLAQGLADGYEVLIQMDADFSHDPQDLTRLLAAIEDGADVAIGSRYVKGGSIPHWPAYRRALSRYGNQYVVLMLRLGIHDATSGFRAYRAGALRAIRFDTTQANHYTFQTELSYRLARWGGKVVEMPIAFTDRVRGTSKMPAATIVESMGMVTWWGIRDRTRRLLGRPRPPVKDIP